MKTKKLYCLITVVLSVMFLLSACVGAAETATAAPETAAASDASGAVATEAPAAADNGISRIDGVSLRGPQPGAYRLLKPDCRLALTCRSFQPDARGLHAGWHLFGGADSDGGRLSHGVGSRIPRVTRVAG